jgi:hypothetical protein
VEADDDGGLTVSTSYVEFTVTYEVPPDWQERWVRILARGTHIPDPNPFPRFDLWRFPWRR